MTESSRRTTAPLERALDCGGLTLPASPLQARGLNPRERVLHRPGAIADAPAREAVAPVPRLVAEVYEASAPEQRVSLIAHLLRPLGALALVVVADGVFARIRFRSGWEQLSVRADDLLDIRSEHVVALANYVAQASVEVVESLAAVLGDSPAAGGPASALLVAALAQRAFRQPVPGPGPRSARP